MTLLDVTAELNAEMQNVTDTLTLGMWLVGGMSSVILLLLGVLWNEAKFRNNRTEDKVDKLTEQVTRLITLMGEVIPETKQNAKDVKDIQINCASNNHPLKKK